MLISLWVSDAGVVLGFLLGGSRGYDLIVDDIGDGELARVAGIGIIGGVADLVEIGAGIVAGLEAEGVGHFCLLAKKPPAAISGPRAGVQPSVGTIYYFCCDLPFLSIQS